MIKYSIVSFYIIQNNHIELSISYLHFAYHSKTSKEIKFKNFIYTIDQPEICIVKKTHKSRKEKRHFL